MNKNHSVLWIVPLECAEIIEKICVAHYLNSFEE